MTTIRDTLAFEIGGLDWTDLDWASATNVCQRLGIDPDWPDRIRIGDEVVRLRAAGAAALRRVREAWQQIENGQPDASQQSLALAAAALAAALETNRDACIAVQEAGT